MKISPKKTFWSAYWQIYRSVCTIRPYQKTVKREIDLLAVKTGGRYLDLACGIGITTNLLLERKAGISVVGTDNSTSGIRIAQHDNPNALFVLADFNRPLPFVQDKFDGVLANNALYLAGNPVATIKNIMSLLKPGGVFVMSTPKEGGDPAAILKAHLQMTKAEYLKKHGKVMTSIKYLFESARSYGIFLGFLPFQIALKAKFGGAANFWSVDKWMETINSTKNDDNGFKVIACEPSYGGQNITIALQKV
jgi:SAM-dependent methyltransferase